MKLIMDGLMMYVHKPAYPFQKRMTLHHKAIVSWFILGFVLRSVLEGKSLEKVNHAEIMLEVTQKNLFLDIDLNIQISEVLQIPKEWQVFSHENRRQVANNMIFWRWFL